MLGLGSYDDKLRIMNTLTWKVISIYECKGGTIKDIGYDVEILKENDTQTPCIYKNEI
jgi:hypothetical protein